MAHGLHVPPTKVFPWPMACSARTSNKGVPRAHGLHVHPTKVFPWPMACTYIQQRCSHGPWLARTSNKRVPRAHGLHVPPTKVFPWPMTYIQQRCSHGPWLAVNKTILKPCLAAANGCANTHMWDFPDIIKFNIAVHTISEKAIRIGLKS